MQLYTGFDLHSSNSYVGIIDENGKRAFNRKLPNNPAIIVDTLRSFRNDITDIAVESTYNWYWLVDLLIAEGYRVHLANPSAIQQYSRLKYADDQHETCKNHLDAARSRRFYGPAQQERVTDTALPMTLIQISDWCSEELTPNGMKLRQRQG